MRVKCTDVLFTDLVRTHANVKSRN